MLIYTGLRYSAYYRNCRTQYMYICARERRPTRSTPSYTNNKRCYNTGRAIMPTRCTSIRRNAFCLFIYFRPRVCTRINN